MSNKTNILKLFTIVLMLIGHTGQCCTFRPVDKDNSKISVVVIDPGHGGKDYGASVSNAREKDIVLNIALKLGNYIKNNYPDIKVVYTRDRDVFIPLYKRAEIANKSEADLFISIHANAIDAEYVQGTETYVLGLHRNSDNLKVAQKENAVILLEDNYNTTYEGFDPNLPESYIMFETMQEEYREQSVTLASNIQNQFRDHAKRVDRSVRMGGFLVLRSTTMPAVLVETGYLSHSNERHYLLSETGQTNLAEAIFRAFSAYKSEIEEKSKFKLVTNIDSNSTTDIKTKSQSASNTQEETNIILSTNTKRKKTNPATRKNTEAERYYSVQIIALKRKLEPTPENFNGEENIFRVDAAKASRYFSGKFSSLAEAEAEQERISKKFQDPFVVAFENGKLISLKKRSK